MKRLYRFYSVTLAAGALLGAPIAFGPVTSAHAAIAPETASIERAENSNLAAVRLPDGAYRSTSKPDLAKFEDALQKIAAASQGRMNKIEVLIWQKSEAGAAMKNLPARFKEASYGYAALDAFDAEIGRVTPFGSVGGKSGSGDSQSDLLGMWIETGDGTTLLAWGRFQASDADAKATPRENERVGEVTPEKKISAELIGSWSWTTISGVNYQDTVTRQLAAPSGMSAKFTFLPNGQYKFFFYVRQRTYNLVSESTTTAEGAVTFGQDGTFTVRPAKGYYKGSTGSRMIDRPMTAEERKPVVWRYEWRTEGGKRALYIGPDSGSMSRFQPEAR